MMEFPGLPKTDQLHWSHKNVHYCEGIENLLQCIGLEFTTMGSYLIIMILLLHATIDAHTDPPLWSQPEQVHLSYGDSPDEMTVTWVTQSEVHGSAVEFGHGKLTELSTPARTWEFINQEAKRDNRSMWIHSATMGKLQPATTYMYHVGSAIGWSDVFIFRSQRVDAEWSPVLAVYGDFGNANAQSIAYLQKAAQMSEIDAVLHIGDFAYDLDTDVGLIGDAFMKQIEPIAAYIPYMTLPGNHEKKFNFSQYRNRFQMPGEFDSMMYSMKLGPARIIMFNSEVFYKNEYPDNYKAMYEQYHWLEAQLQNANLASERAVRPWVMALAHRPMYCSTMDGYYGHCNNPNNPVRVGLNNVTREYSLEDLFYKYGVDLQFYGHEHSYERLWPLYHDTVCNGTVNNPYTNPTAPVHIITGSAGNREGQTGFDKKPWSYSAFRSDDYGYTLMKIVNHTHISIDQISTDKGGAVLDSMILVKEKHGMGTFTCHKNSKN